MICHEKVSKLLIMLTITNSQGISLLTHIKRKTGRERGKGRKRENIIGTFGAKPSNRPDMAIEHESVHIEPKNPGFKTAPGKTSP